jgi:hypothetical protein
MPNTKINFRIRGIKIQPMYEKRVCLPVLLLALIGMHRISDQSKSRILDIRGRPDTGIGYPARFAYKLLNVK